MPRGGKRPGAGSPHIIRTYNDLPVKDAKHGLLIKLLQADLDCAVKADPRRCASFSHNAGNFRSARTTFMRPSRLLRCSNIFVDSADVIVKSVRN